MTTSSTQLGSRTTSTNMASGNRGVSRLGMMQAKLQEQLMVEKESRLLEMAARQEAERDYTIQRVTKSSASSLSSSLSSLSLGSSFSGGQGRVRKLFEDRRQTGYDKSYPLQPVRGKPNGKGEVGKPPARGGAQSNGRGVSSERAGVGGTKTYGGSYGQRSKSQIPPNQRTTKPPGNNINKQNNNSSRLGHHKSNPSLLDANRLDNNNATTNNNSNGSRSSGPSPLPPSMVRRQPPPKKPSPAPYKSSPAPSPRSPTPVKQSIRSKAPASLAPSPIPRRGSTASSAPATPRAVPPGMEQCPICERNFNSDRIEKHRTICEKSKAKAKKRKVFDPVKMRNKGTEAEKYVARGLHLKKENKPKKKDWRKQHEDFIATVRAAKGIQGYEAPPLDTSDYLECPHCGRKFNQGAGERHIPKCADIKSNKPAGGRKR